MKAVYVEHIGGVDALRYGERPKPEPGNGEVLVRVAASGINFIDTYHRSGLYKVPMPAVLGMEGAGVVETVGSGVTDVRPGDRVAWAMWRGSYAEYATVPAARIVPVPAGVDLRDAAAAMLQGMTAHYLTHSTFVIAKGHTALVHAAAGGTGRLITQMVRMRGGRVIGTAGSPAKADVARAAGADEVVLYREEDFVAEVRRFTSGAGVDVVYDGVGRATFLHSLDCLKPRGLMVSFGQSSGAVDPVDPLLLSSKGSLYLTRPSLGHYISPEELQWRASDVLGAVLERKLTLLIGQAYPLAEVAAAHRDLEARQTTGKLILVV